MRFSVPVHVRRLPVEGNEGGDYEVTPLFVPFRPVRHRVLSRALTDMAQAIRATLERAARRMDSDAVLAWSFSPMLEEHRFDLSIALRKRTPRCRFLIACFKALERRVAFAPSVPGLWFEVRRGQSMHRRAEEALTHHFRDMERQGADDIRVEDYGISGRAFLTTIDIEIWLPLVLVDEPEADQGRAWIFGQERIWGSSELRTIGECLDWRYPDDLARAILREHEVEELTRLLAAPDRRPVLLLGPRQAGKTAILHEHVYRVTEARRRSYDMEKTVWQLSPQRIISGMSVVGQWENRLLAVMKEACNKDITLYFDDLLGLYTAGVCASSALSVAQVLKPHVESREFRVVAELTPEAFRILQERDRGMADLFHIIRVVETTREQTLRIMITAMRWYEAQQGCRFDVDALPAIMELQERYARDAAFPGKTASHARMLAVTRPGEAIGRGAVLEEFQRTAGLSLAFLDGRCKLERKEIEEGIRRNLIGQDAALQAVSDAICTAKARLNDPERPLGTFLFVGPTGVGKTQCAKAAAAYLFGAFDRLVRFDMNEYGDPRSAARLVGTFLQPDGLLTGEIKRRPFCVVLLDEIEKAHPDVFDLLLQVLGEGRLTDAWGRTADFRNTLIILTSNLGVREAQSRLGFLEDGHSLDHVYIEAARRFFRPEFFNRLDRVVPFAPLSRGEIEMVARRLIGEVMGRHGLRQRKCALQVASSAMDRLVDAGYHPTLGARALKRIVEHQLAQPVATCLAAMPPGMPTVITAFAGSDGIAASTQVLVDAEPRQPPAILAADPGDVVKAATSFLRRVQSLLADTQPAQPIRVGDLRPEQHVRIAVMEQLRHAARLHDRLAESSDPTSKPPPLRRSLIRAGRPVMGGKGFAPWGHRRSLAPLLHELLATDRTEEMLREGKANGQSHRPHLADDTRELIAECALLDAMLRRAGDSRVLLCVCASDGAYGSLCSWLERFYRVFCWDIWGYQIEDVLREPPTPAEWRSGRRDLGGRDVIAWEVTGPAAAEVLRMEEGTHLLAKSEEIAAAALKVIPLADSEDAAAVLRRESEARGEWVRGLADGSCSLDDDPFRYRSVVRLLDWDRMIIDLRTGVTATGMWNERLERRFVRPMVLDMLPVPEEFGP